VKWLARCQEANQAREEVPTPRRMERMERTEALTERIHPDQISNSTSMACGTNGTLRTRFWKQLSTIESRKNKMVQSGQRRNAQSKSVESIKLFVVFVTLETAANWLPADQLTGPLLQSHGIFTPNHERKRRGANASRQISSTH